MDNNKHPKGKVVDSSDDKEMLKMAAYFSQKELSNTEWTLGLIASVIFYGVGFGMIILLIIKAGGR